MDQITQQNASVVVQMDAAAKRMHWQASEARNNIRVFRLARGEQTHAETDAVALRRTHKEMQQHNPPALAEASPLLIAS